MLCPYSARNTEADEDVLRLRQEVWLCPRVSCQAVSRLLEVHWERPQSVLSSPT